MQASLLLQFRSRRISIRDRWTALLRAEPVTTPLALPEALVHLIDGTLDEVFAILEANPAQGCPSALSVPAVCPCGRNPLLAYYGAARQALHEALIFSQADVAPLDPRVRDWSFAELNYVLGEISRREIEAFCGMCQLRDHSDRVLAVDVEEFAHHRV